METMVCGAAAIQRSTTETSYGADADTWVPQDWGGMCLGPEGRVRGRLSDTPPAARWMAGRGRQDKGKGGGDRA